MVLSNYLTVSSLTDLEIFGGGFFWSSVLSMLWKSKAVPRVLKLREVDCVSLHWPVEEEELLPELALPCFAALQVLGYLVESESLTNC